MCTLIFILLCFSKQLYQSKSKSNWLLHSHCRLLRSKGGLYLTCTQICVKSVLLGNCSCSSNNHVELINNKLANCWLLQRFDQHVLKYCLNILFSPRIMLQSFLICSWIADSVIYWQAWLRVTPVLFIYNRNSPALFLCVDGVSVIRVCSGADAVAYSPQKQLFSFIVP